MKRFAPLLWTLLWLVAFDALTNAWTQYPPEPSNEAAIGAFQRYFNYGRSIESKVRWMTARNDERASPLAQAGWLPSHEERELQTTPYGKQLVAIYGMSFSARVGAELARNHDRFIVRLYGGPAATVPRSYADYVLDRGRHDASVVVLGVLASSLPATATVTHMTWNFEAPSPHFYPSFAVIDGRLTRLDPPVGSLKEFRAALADPLKWRTLVDFLAEHDAFYDPLAFRADVADHSIVGRLLRRAWAQSAQQRRLSRFHDGSGFTDHQGSVTTTLAILEAFARQVRGDGKLPVVLLFNDRGFSDHLYQALHGRLEELDVPYISSHEVADPDDPVNFVQDGHFKEGLDAVLAARLAELIDRLSTPER